MLGETPVWVDTPRGQVEGRIIQPAETPRSYEVEVPSGARRNRAHIQIQSSVQHSNVGQQSPATNRGSTRVSRIHEGTAPGPPEYLCF